MKSKLIKLVILDYSTNIVHIYHVPAETEITDSYIEKLGFKLSQVNYILGNLDIIFHHIEED